MNYTGARSIYPGTVVYVRHNGEILALKCTKFMYKFYTGDGRINEGSYMYNWVTPLGEVIEDHNFRLWFKGYGNIYIYSTIEDAIHAENQMQRLSSNAFTWERANNIARSLYPDNYVEDGDNSYIKSYAWDGYCVKSYKHLLKYAQYEETNEGWTIKLPQLPTGGKEYFFTKEEAQVGHKTKVVDF